MHLKVNDNFTEFHGTALCDLEALEKDMSSLQCEGGVGSASVQDWRRKLEEWNLYIISIIDKVYK